MRTRARAVMTAVVIFAFFTALASVLYVGAQDVIAHRMTGGTLLQFSLFGGFGRRWHQVRCRKSGAISSAPPAPLSG